MFWNRKEHGQKEASAAGHGLRRLLPHVTAALIAGALTIAGAAAFTAAEAVEVPDLSRTDGSVTLDLNYVDPDDKVAKVLQDGTATIYKVAGFSDAGTFDTSQGVFEDLVDSVDSLRLLGVFNSEQLDKINESLAVTLNNSTDGRKGTPIEITSELNGSASFEGLSTGLYLVTFVAGESKVAFNPFLVSVPQRNDDGTYTYQVNADPKYDVVPGGENEPEPDNSTTSFDFRKVWTKGNKKVAWASQPAIRIKIRRSTKSDQETTDYITITKDSVSEDVETPFKAIIKWNHTADDVYTYTISGLEKYREGDTSNPWTYELQEAKVTGHDKPKYSYITNENGQEKTSAFTYDAAEVFVPLKDNTVLQIENPASKTPESEPPEGGGGNKTPTPSGGGGSTPSGGSGGGGRLPQTGQLWWPVPLLVLAGIVLVLSGVILRRKGRSNRGRFSV